MTDRWINCNRACDGDHGKYDPCNQPDPDGKHRLVGIRCVCGWTATANSAEAVEDQYARHAHGTDTAGDSPA